VLTYLSGIGSTEASGVGVATRFREEHRAAIDWSNRSTIDGYDFLGVEIEVIRIGDRAPAPRFNVVAMQRLGPVGVAAGGIPRRDAAPWWALPRDATGPGFAPARRGHCL